MDQLNNPVSNLSYIPSELSYTSPQVNLGITDLLTLPDPGVTQASSQPVDHIQAGLERMSKLKPDYQTRNQSQYFDYQGTNAARYVGSTNYNALGFDPEIGRENEYKYGAMQTTGDMFGNAFAGAYKLAASTFVDGWKGWGRMTDALVSWDSNKLMGSPEELYQLNMEQKSIMDKYAIYQTQASENTIFNRQLLGDMIQQSGFALGTTAQFLSEELLTMGLSSAFSLTKMGLTSGAKIAKGAYKMGELTADAKKLGDIWKAEGIVKQIYEGAKKLVPLVNTVDDVAKAHKAGASALQMAAIGMGGIKRSLAEMNMAMTEARMEAAGTYGDLYDKLYNEHMQKTGQAPIGSELERIERMAKAGAEDNFMVNTGVLAVMNRIQFDNLFSKFAPERRLLKEMGQYADDVLKVSGKVGGKELTQVYKKGITGALGQAGKIAEDFGRKKAAWEITKDLGKGMFKWEVSEGVQELIQEGSNVALQDYYYDLYNGKASMDASVDEAVQSQMNQQGFKTFMMGALTGRLISPVTGAFAKGTELVRTTKEQRQGRETDFKESIELINAFYKDPAKALNENIANFNVQNKAAKNMEEALAQHDEYYYNNSKDSAFAKMISAAKKTNMLESVLDTIREYGNHLDEKQMKEAFPSVDPSENNLTNAKAYFNKIANDVERFNKTWETLKDKYGDIVRPDLYKEGSEDYYIALRAQKALNDSLEILATNKFKAERAVERAQKIYSQVQENSAVGQSSAYAFRVMSNDKQIQKEIDILTGEILSMTQADTISKEAREQIKKKNDELDALLEFQKHWVQEDISDSAVLNVPALKKAYTSYLNARNKTSNLNTQVTVTDIDDSWTMFMDYANLNKDAIEYTDAFNTVANPTRFVQMFDAKREAIAEVMEKMRQEAVEEAEAKQEQKLLPAARIPEKPEGDDPEDPQGGEPKGKTNLGQPTASGMYEVAETADGKFTVLTPEGKQILFPPVADREEAQSEADFRNESKGLTGKGKPKPKNTESYHVIELPDGSFGVYNRKGKLFETTMDREEAELSADTYNEANGLPTVYKKGEPVKGPIKPPPARKPEGDPDAELQKEIDNLSLAATTVKTLGKASKAVRALFDKLIGKSDLIDQLKAKIGEVKDQLSRNALMQIVNGKVDEPSYVPIPGMVNNQHVGVNKQSIKGYNGIQLTTQKGSTVMVNLSQSQGDLNGKVTVTATKKIAQENAQEAAALNIPNRKHITFENADEIKQLQKGKSVLTVGKKTSGVHVSISSPVGAGEMYVMGLDTYFIVHPDNTTVPVTFDESQRTFVMENLLVNGNPMTDAQYDQFRKDYLKFSQFQDKALEILSENEDGDVTTLFNQYFSLTPGGVQAQPDEDMTSVFKNNPENLFPVMVKDEEGNILEKRLPLIAVRQKNTWVFNFLTDNNETVVDEEGDAVDNAKNYVASVFGVNPVLNYTAPYVWIAYKPQARAKHFNKLMGRKRGTEPVEGYKAFLKEFGTLNQALKDGKATEQYKYDGRVFTSTNTLMTYFNQKKFGFFTAGNWFVDLSYSPKSKTQAFTLELRPKNTNDRRSLTPEQKSALDVFFNFGPMTKLINMITEGKATDAEIKQGYDEWMKSLISGYNKMIQDLRNSNDPKLKAYGNDIDYHTIFFYEEENDQKNYMLKLTDKSEGLAMAPMLVFKGGSNNVTGQVNISLKTDSDPATYEPVASEDLDSVDLGDMRIIYTPVANVWHILHNEDGLIGNDNGYATKEEALEAAKGFQETLNKTLVADLKSELEKISKLPFAERIPALVKIGVIDSNLSTQMGVRFPIIVNVNGVKVPFYRSSAGTDGKVKGSWNPFFGFGKSQNGDPWLIKGESSQFNNYYNNPAIEKYSKILDDLLSWDSSADSVRGVGNHPFMNTLKQVSLEEFNNEVYGVSDLNIINGTTGITNPLTFVEARLQEIYGNPNTVKSDTTAFNDNDITFNPEAYTPDEDLFMLSDEGVRRYTENVYNEEVNWLLNNASLQTAGIKLSDLSGIIQQLTAGKEILGYYRNRAIYVDQAMSAEGTIYHEAFHALFRDILNSGQRGFYLGKALQKLGAVSKEDINKFRNERNYHNKSDKQILDLMAEELLADGFRDYKLKQKEPAESWFKIFVKWLERMLNFLKSDAIQDLYKDFDAGNIKTANSQVSNIADEGVYSLATGRPLLTLVTNAEGKSEIRPIMDSRFLRPLNMEVQKEIVNKLSRMVSNKGEALFEQRFAEAVEELKAEYDIRNLIKQAPQNEAAIRAKYGTFFTEAAFVLGAVVPYDTDDSLAGNTKVSGLMIPAGSNKKTLDIIKADVNTRVNTLGLDSGWVDGDFSIPEEDDEDKVEKEKGGEFDLIHMNPLAGISKEFRALFSLIPYQEKDEELGVTLTRMADGNMLFNAVIKVASDRPTEEILPALIVAVEALEEDGDRKAAQLRALADELGKQFGIQDISDPTATPSRNLHLYKQFIDTFFVTELPSSVVVVSMDSERGTSANVYDASIKADINNRKEAIGFHFNREYKKLKTPEEKAEFLNKFTELKDYFENEMKPFLANSNINNRKKLNEQVDKLYDKLVAINILLPKLLLRRSLQAIYVREMGMQFNANSKESIRETEADQSLIKRGAYLQMDFFNKLSKISESTLPHLFADTQDERLNLSGNDKADVDGINSILKKATELIIKYDINSAIPVFQNAENANIWRYSRYTPPILLAQLVREKGISEITKLYPILADWFKDNPLFDGSVENELFLKNLNIESFNGFRENIDGENVEGVTFGNIDTKALLISNLVHFMNRETIFTKQKNSKGKYDEHMITTFKRSRTQEEATTTNFLVTGRYRKYVQDGTVSTDFVKDTKVFFKQEYNRIQREWARRNDTSIPRYSKYNELGKEDGQRAYQFMNMDHFFTDPSLTPGQLEVRQALREDMIQAAKDGKSFDDIMAVALTNGTINQVLEREIAKYAEDTFKVYMSKLQDMQIVKTRTIKDAEILFSPFLSTGIREDFLPKVSLASKGYEGLEDLILDHHLNVFMNKMMVNQIFDGDIATGIKSATEYYKRNKSGVISGNSMKRGFIRTAVVENLQVFINEEDLTEETSDFAGEGLRGVDVADGQSYHTMNHRIRMMDAWGRVTPSIRTILNAYKYRALTKDEIEELEDNKVVLNTIKTATGGVFEYYKLSEHLISRVDVSYLNPEKGSKDDVYDALDQLYMQIETLEDMIVENPSRDDAAEIEAQIEDLYRDVHSYWLPKRNRAKMHYMLNSMEKSGVDQLFDPNASKKTTLVPVKLEMDTATNLKPSKSNTLGLFKFLQVETSGIKKYITDPSQSRQLISTYLNKLDTESAYQGMSLAQLAKEYEKVMGDITKSNTRKLNTAIFKDGKLDIASVFKMMRKGLAEQGADSNTLKFFDLENGQPVHNVNLPIIKKHFTYYYFSLYNDSIYNVPVSGRSDILVSAYGYDVLYNKRTGKTITDAEYMVNPEMYSGDEYDTRHLGITSEVNADGLLTYFVEVMIPKPLASSPEEERLYLEKLNKFFSTRIPTEDKRSMVVAKVVDYIDSAYQNSIIVPQLVHILAGSDLDVDKLYSHTFEFYKDFNDKPHVYGDYSGYKTESQGKFIEYINYMLNDRTLSDLISEQMDAVSTNPVIPESFLKLKDELQISEMVTDKEYLVDKRKGLELQRAVLASRYASDKAAHDAAYEDARQKGRGDVTAQKDFAKARTKYKYLMNLQAITQNDLNNVREELAKINKTLKLLALHNVLESKGFPTTQAGLTKWSEKNSNPVVPVLQNERLQMKMDILSNQRVFNEQYIKEKSDTKPFKDIAKAIGASVEDVVNQNSIYSIMGDVVANELNSSNKDGIGITASFNKFLAFAQKNNLSLPQSIFIKEGSVIKMHNSFQDSAAIRNIGATLGMFADAAKEPIPSVLNLNPETSFVSNLMVGIGIPLQAALLINKLPYVEAATKSVQNGTSAAKDPSIYGTSIATELNTNVIAPILTTLREEDRLDEMFSKDKSGRLIRKKFTIEIVEPAGNAASIPAEDMKLSDLGFVIYDEKGKIVKEDVGNLYMAMLYTELLEYKSPVLGAGKILNLIKSQRPDFYALDDILSTYAEFGRSKKPLNRQIYQVLSRSAEYTPLLNAVKEQTRNATQVLIDRSSLFKTLNGALINTVSFGEMNTKTASAFSDQLLKFVIVNRVKADMNEEYRALKAKPNPNPVAMKVLEDGLKLFTADFWTNNEEELASRLDYLYENHPSNPFVEFLKLTRKEGIHFLEASTRMKLDKDIAEGIIMGYEALQKSLDPESKAISRFMFNYLLVKDNLGYGSNSFISYVSPDLKQFRDVSVILNDFHAVLKEQEPVIDKLSKRIQAIQDSPDIPVDAKKRMIKENTDKLIEIINKDFDKLFKNNTGKKVDWIPLMIRKTIANAASQKYFREAKAIRLNSSELKQGVQEMLDKGFLGDREFGPLKGKVNFFAEELPSYIVDYSNLTLSPIVKEVSKKLSFGIIEDEDSGEFNAVFPLVIRASNDRLLKLDSVDGEDMSSNIIKNMFTAGATGVMSGKTAVYKSISVEGTTKLSNLGFTNADGAKIRQYSLENSKAEESTTSIFGYDPNKIFKEAQQRRKENPGSDGSISFDTLPGKSAVPTMTYAGIGSRSTPADVLVKMTEVAKYLESKKGYTLNTGVTFKGKEEGADKAFSDGATKKNLFSPEVHGSRATEQFIAQTIHPNPNALKPGALQLMARNTNQIFGDKLDTPVDFVIFYAEEVPGSIRPKGGTGQAVEMARRKGIPTINMADANWRDQLKAALSSKPVVSQPALNSKFEGNMTFSYGANKRSDVKADTTFDAILNGERTATTRYESDGNLDYWKNAKVGDVITWKSKDGRTVDVVVTKALHPLKGSGKTAETWSKLEGWSTTYFSQKVKSRLDQAWQIEYKLIDPASSTNIPEQTLLTKAEISQIYLVKERDETLKEFKQRINEYIAALGNAPISKDEIIEQLKSCL